MERSLHTNQSEETGSRNRTPRPHAENPWLAESLVSASCKQDEEVEIDFGPPPSQGEAQQTNERACILLQLLCQADGVEFF